MKAVILHATDCTSKSHWYPWLRRQLEQNGFDVWSPDLPGADYPSIKKYTDFLMRSDWDFSNNLVIGHSSGAVEILALLEALPLEVTIDTAILIGAFRGDLGWEKLKDMNAHFDMSKIKSKAKNFIVIHSDDDPYCPLENAQSIADELNASMKIFHGKQHFSKSLDPRFEEFPELVEIIKNEVKI